MRGVQRPGAALPFGAEHVVKLAASACQTGVGSFSLCSVRRGGTWALVSGWLACLRWRLWFLVVRDRLRLGGRELRPAAHHLFLLAQEKKAKEVRPAVRDPFALLRGNLRCSRAGCSRRTRFAPLALRSDSCGQSDHEAWTSFGVPAHPARCASRHGQRGWGRRFGPLLRSALGALTPALSQGEREEDRGRFIGMSTAIVRVGLVEDLRGAWRLRRGSSST